MVNYRSIDDFLSELYLYKHRAYYGSRKRILRSCEIPLPLLALCIANSADATEILMLSYLLADSRFREEMFSEDSSSSSMEGAEYLASSIFAGMLIGGTVLGFLSDRIGRRPALLLGLLTNAVAGACSSLPIFAPSLIQLTMWRFIAGIGIGATVPPLFTLVSEWSSKEVRGVFVTAVASFWMVGSIFVSSLAWCLFQLDPNHVLPIWRIFAATCALPSLLGAWMVYSYVPESPRFYLAAEKRDYDLAARTCNQMALYLNVRVALDHKKERTLLGVTFDQRAVHPLTKDELFSNHQENGVNKFNSLANAQSPSNRAKLNQAINSSVDSLRKLYSNQLLPRTTLPLQLLWFCLSFTTYGITTWINTLFVAIQLENLYFNSFLFALATLPGNIVSLVYSDKYGRKTMLIGSLLGAACGLGIFATAVYAGSGQENDDQSSASISSVRTFVIVLCACAFQAFGAISWNTIDIVTAEMFPTNVRSAGMGVCTATGRLGGILSQYVNARLIVDDTGAGAAWVLVVASISLIFGAGMPLALDRDMVMEELRDDAIEGSTDYCCPRNKDHVSDEETDMPQLQLQSSRSLEYQSFQQEVESNQPFLL